MVILIGIGLAAIYSATFQSDSPRLQSNFRLQLLWVGVGSVFFAGALFLPFRFYQSFAYVLYGLAVAALIAVLITGRSVGGATRWLSVAGLRVQPSEWAKLATILALARFLSDRSDKVDWTITLVGTFGLGLLPALLIFKQPDLGTAMLFLVLIPSMLFWAGVPTLTLFLIFAPLITMIASFNFYTFFSVMVILTLVLILSRRNLLLSLIHVLLNVSIGLITPLLWGALHPYQQKRVLSFLGLVSDPKGLGYQVIQSKVAIGSGGFWGKGFLKGTQTQLRFLPQQHTDFIFSVVGEEFGFIGGMAVILLFVILILRSFRIAALSYNRFASTAAVGLATLFLYHAVVNIGMSMGIMPVTGLPLPFLSYGGSFLIVCMTAVGMLINFSIRRLEY